MTTPTLDRPAATRRSKGGRPARRAVVRWAWRLVRRDARQQLLILALLTFTVAGAVAGSTAVYNLPADNNAEFGTATEAIVVRGDGTDSTLVAQTLSKAQSVFGITDVITHTSKPVPGTKDVVDVRGQDPNGPYGSSLLRLRSGKYPLRAGEVAVTDRVAEIFGADVGDSLALEGTALRIVGLVENPRDLTDEFALVRPGELSPDSARVLVRAAGGTMGEFAQSRTRGVSFRRPGRGTSREAAGGVLALSTLVLLLVGLVSAASFTVIAQRRLRQIGMLAAIGATERHVRLVMVATGVFIGVLSVVIGTVLGLAGWMAGAQRLETVARHRIDRLNVPWWTLVAMALLAIGAATAAAWLPARAAARIPITAALAARAPRPKSTHRSAVFAVVLLAAGVSLLWAADQTKAVWIVTGIVASALGLVFASPIAVRVLAACASRLPLASRLAVRDMGRYEARSGTALAAISLSLGIAVTVLVTATAAGFTAQTGNLAPNQLLVGFPSGCPCLAPFHTDAELAQLQTDVDGIAGELAAAAVLPLDVAVDATMPERTLPQEGSSQVRRVPDARDVGAPSTPRSGDAVPVVSLGRRIEANLVRDLGPLYVATPELLAHLKLGTTRIDPQAEVLTIHSGALAFANTRKDGLRDVRSAQVEVPKFSSGPTSLITPSGLVRGRWTAQRSGWLLTLPGAVTAEQAAAARQAAVEAGLTIEVRSDSRALGRTKSVATAIGMLLALAVLAMTVGLIRSESNSDLLTLSASGASNRVRRGLTATTAGAMGLLGVLLGTTVAYAALIAAYRSDLDRLSRVPVGHLAVIVVGIPLLAYAGGWLFAGREPESLGSRTAD